MNDLRNTVAFELSVMREVTCHHLAELADSRAFNFATGLEKPHIAPRDARDYLSRTIDIDGAVYRTSITSRVNAFEVCSRKDVVLVRSGGAWQAGEVWLHADANDVPVSLVSLWECSVLDRSTQVAEWIAVDNPTMIETDDIMAACIYRRPREGIVRTLLPATVR